MSKSARLLGVLLAMSPLVSAANAVVLRAVADMHAAPGEDSGMVSQAIYGTNVSILEEKNNWARVQTPDAYSGWVYRAFLRRSPTAYAESNFYSVTSLFANVYREPDATRHVPLLTVPLDARLERAGEAIGEGERWLGVRLVDGRLAYVQAGDVTGSPKQLPVSDLIGFSKRFLGLPYLWGGSSTFGYDCSGFTQMLMRQRGVLMPRDASVQAAWTGVSHVNRDSLRAGDLLFFGQGEKITHTGMYIGNGEFINATTHERPMVQICRLADPHWSKLFVCARRLR